MKCLLLQFWDCLFKVTVVDCLVRLVGFTGKGVVLLTHPHSRKSAFAGGLRSVKRHLHRPVTSLASIARHSGGSRHLLSRWMCV